MVVSSLGERALLEAQQLESGLACLVGVWEAQQLESGLRGTLCVWRTGQLWLGLVESMAFPSW